MLEKKRKLPSNCLRQLSFIRKTFIRNHEGKAFGGLKKCAFAIISFDNIV